MEFDLTYDESRIDLHEKVQAKTNEGWQRAGNVLPVPNLDREISHLIYYVQVLVRNDKKKKEA